VNVSVFSILFEARFEAATEPCTPADRFRYIEWVGFATIFDQCAVLKPRPALHAPRLKCNIAKSHAGSSAPGHIWISNRVSVTFALSNRTPIGRRQMTT